MAEDLEVRTEDSTKRVTGWRLNKRTSITFVDGKNRLERVYPGELLRLEHMKDTFYVQSNPPGELPIRSGNYLVRAPKNKDANGRIALLPEGTDDIVLYYEANRMDD